MKKIYQTLISGYFRRNRKEWGAIAGVIFCSVVFLCTIISSCLGAISSLEQFIQDQYGSHQFQVFNVQDEKREDIEGAVGRIELKGYFVNEQSLYYDAVILGTVDELALEVGNMRLLQGSMPQSKGEIAIEESVLKRMQLNANIGDEIQLPVYWTKDRQYQENATEQVFTITGIIKDYSRIWMSDGSDPYNGFPGIWISDSENDKTGIKIDIIELEGIETTEQLEVRFQELSEIYTENNPVGYNINTYISAEKDSLESQKGMYLTMAAIFMGTAIMIIMSIAIVSVISLGIEERKRQQVILRQLGLNSRRCSLVIAIQIFGSASIGILPGIVVSILLSAGLKSLLSGAFGIYMTDSIPSQLIALSVLLVLLAVGVTTIIIERFLNRSEQKIRKSKSTDYVQRVCNGHFHIQKGLGILLLSCSFLIVIPVQFTIGHYETYFSHPLEKDVNISLNSMMGNGNLQISEGRQGINFSDYEKLTQIEGLTDLTYAMQLEAAKILLANDEKEKEYQNYRSPNETVIPLESSDVGDGIDYLSRDKEYYGYQEESVLIPCTIQGIRWEEVEQLASYLVEGTLDEEQFRSGKETIAVVWEEEYSVTYPIQIGDTITLTNLVMTEMSQNYWENPHEAARVDTTANIGAILKVPLDLTEELGCVFARGSYTFIRSIEALGDDGHDISYQSISFDYETDAKQQTVDEKINEIISHYSYVSFSSQYEQQKAEQEFKSVVYVFGGSIWVLTFCLSIFIIYRKIVSTLLLKKKQLFIMWCMGMNKGHLKESMRREILSSIGCASVIAISILVGVSFAMKATYMLQLVGFVLGSASITFLTLQGFVNRWINHIEFNEMH